MYSVLPFITSFLFVFLGAFAFAKRKQAKANRVFLFLCLATFIWQFSWGVLFLPFSSKVENIIIEIGYSGIIFIPIVYFHFLVAFLKFQSKEEKLIRFSYAAGFLALAALWSGQLFIDGKYKYFWGSYPKAGLLHPLYLGLLAVLTCRGVMLLVSNLRLRKNSARAKMQTRYVLASLLFYIPASSDFVINYGVEFYPIGFAFIFVSFMIIAYAMLRHQLLEIEVVVKKTIVFAGLFAASYAVFAGFAYLGALFFESFIKSRWIAMGPSIFVIVMILRPLENFLREVTDRYLFQKKYDYRYLLRTFSDEVLTVLNLSSLVSMTVNKLSEIIKLDGASIFLRSDKDDFYSITASSGSESSISFSSDLFSRAVTSGGYLLKPDSHDDRLLAAEFDKKGISLIVMLSHRNIVVGALVLGRKLSDEEFTQDDVDIILTLAKTLSIAIVNARLFEQLSEAQAQAAQREKMAVIGTLSAGINHEICNPLGIIRGQCEMFLLNLRDGLYKDTDPNELIVKARAIMEKVVREVDRAAAITKKLSSFAKPASGKITPEVNLAQEIEEVIALVGHDLYLDNIEIIREVEKDTPLISADRKQVQEIFFNIIRNAAQAIKSNGRIEIKIYRTKSGVSASVKDTGIGIAGSDIGKIFNPFFTTKDPGKGSGLGLFIVKQIVERNNGKISVESIPGKGTEFTVEFMIVEAAQMASA